MRVRRRLIKIIKKELSDVVAQPPTGQKFAVVKIGTPDKWSGLKDYDKFMTWVANLI